MEEGILIPTLIDLKEDELLTSPKEGYIGENLIQFEMEDGSKIQLTDLLVPSKVKEEGEIIEDEDELLQQHAVDDELIFPMDDENDEATNHEEKKQKEKEDNDDEEMILSQDEWLKTVKLQQKKKRKKKNKKSTSWDQQTEEEEKKQETASSREVKKQNFSASAAASASTTSEDLPRVFLPPPIPKDAPPYCSWFADKEWLKQFVLNEIRKHESKPVQVKFKKLFKDVKIPQKATPGSANYDVFCPRDVWIQPGNDNQIHLGFKVIIPHGKKIVFTNRSGWAIIKNMHVKGQPTTIDSDFRGGASIYIENRGSKAYLIEKDRKIAQCGLEDAKEIEWVEVEEINDTDDGSTRGSGGFGSTGF